MRAFELVGLGMVAVVVSACNGARDHVRALDALHNADGSVRFVAPIETKTEAMMRELLELLPTSLDVGEPELVRVDDPYELTLEHLIGLSESDPSDPTVRALMVSNLAWYAVRDPYVLARERSVEGLGHVGAVIGLEGLAAEPATPASPDDVLEQVRALVAAMTAADRNEGGWEGLLDAAASALQAAEFDVEGGHHVLRTLTRLIPLASSAANPAWVPFWTLLDELERDLVAQSLALAHNDPESIVRAAALRAGLEATNGNAEAMPKLLYEDRSEEVRAAGMRWLAEHGFPRQLAHTDESGSSEDRAMFEARWVKLAIAVLQEDRLEGAGAVWACRALEKLTDAPLSTLRGEEWLAWYFDGGGRLGSASSSGT